MICIKMSDKNKFDFYIQDSNYPFTGWDFSHIEKRMIEAPLTWSYTSKILFYVKNSSTLLDIGTGGGEFLSSIYQYLPKVTHATEEYEPNVKIAKKRLETLGVKVHHVNSKSKIPFNDSFFELIINRHANYNLKELYRLLKKEGVFITQQVGQGNNNNKNILLDILENRLEEKGRERDLNNAADQLDEVGFTIIEKKEDFPLTRIYDIGALIYWLKAIPWIIDDFSVEKYKENLLKIHKKIETEDYIDIQSHRFFIIAKKE